MGLNCDVVDNGEDCCRKGKITEYNVVLNGYSYARY